MVGLSGVIGPDVNPHERLVADLRWTGGELTTTYSDEQLTITAGSHPYNAEPQPAWTADRAAALWLWGDVWGFDRPDDTAYVLPDESPAAFCASLYEDYGLEFVQGLNGNFVGIVYDTATRTVTFFTDRLGTRPLHYAQTADGIVFSTNIQSLPFHPAVEPAFDLEYLAEYFTLQRSFGVKTPIRGVELLHPGSLSTVSLDDGSLTVERYWQPVYDPIDRPRSYFATRLADLLERAAAERTNPDTTYGLLLSGGSDSRLTLAALSRADCDIHAYHLNDWWNREAEIAYRVVKTADVTFTYLCRDREYQASMLPSTPRISTFSGYFNQVHAGGFMDDIAGEVDVLFTGHYGDMLFKGNHLPTWSIDLDDLGSFDLPIEKPVTSLDELVASRTTREAPAYIADALERSIREIYAADVTRRNGRVVDHGIEYPSLREATLCSRYPLTNGTSHFFYYGLTQMMPSGTLFLDNRLIDLFLSIPIGYLIRGNLIGQSLDELHPSLAAIPHANASIPLAYPSGGQWLSKLVTAFRRRHVTRSPTEPHWTHGPWSDYGELIRSQDFIREALDEHERLIRRLPFLSWEGVNACYDAHLNGEDHVAALYTLVTFLEMPATQRIGEAVGRPRPEALEEQNTDRSERDRLQGTR